MNGLAKTSVWLVLFLFLAPMAFAAGTYIL